jgi:hypothetical protein
MATYSPTNTPEQNLSLLANNPYPGRLLVVGFAGEAAVLAYAVQGRSEGSRNRRLIVQDNIAGTEIADTSLPVGDPELTIYDAMRRVYDVEIVSNGNQTDRVVRYLRSGKTIAQALEATDHEPDKPNFTPRITGFIDGDPDDGEPFIGISVISKNPKGEGSLRRLYTSQSKLEHAIGLDPDGANVGWSVHTYQGEGDPLPSFDEPPFKIPVYAEAKDMAEMLWENMDRSNRVAVVAKTVTALGLTSFHVIDNNESYNAGMTVSFAR